MVQASHAYNPGLDAKSLFSEDLGIGVDMHWPRYQPTRETSGFQMGLGHAFGGRLDYWEDSLWFFVDEKGRCLWDRAILR